MLREFQPLRPHAVDPRRLDDLSAVAAEIAVAQIIREDVDDVWFGREGRKWNDKQRKKQKKANHDARLNYDYRWFFRRFTAASD